MAIRIHLTLDLFLYRWNEADGVLWACVQPHVEEADIFAWVDRSEMGEELEYRVVPRDAPGLVLVPVSLPDVSDITLQLRAGTENRDLTNRRRSGVRVTEAGREQIALDNREPERRFGPSMEEPAPRPAPLYAGPFALGYNRTLRDARAGRLEGTAESRPASAGDLAQMLRLAFWGGTRRIIRSTAVEDLDRVHLMALPGSVQGERLVTNLHSLNGLMFLVGTRADLDFFTRVDGLVLRLHGDDLAAPQHTIDLGADPQAARSIPAYFSHLRDPLPADLVTAAVVPALARRVYALDNATAYAPLGLAGRAWYRRRRERAGRPEIDLRDVTRIVAHVRGDFPETPPASLEWRFYETVEARLVPYRRYPAAAAQGAGRGVVLRLLPTDADRDRFYRRLVEDPAWLDEAVFFDTQGQEVRREWVRPFLFPWDQDEEEFADPASPLGPGSRPTVLLYAAVPPRPEVTVAVRQRRQGADLSVRTPLVGQDPEVDHHGLRWELTAPAGLPAARVDILELLAPPPFADLLVPAVCVRGDVTFEFAQSLSKIEGRLDVTYPAEPEVERPEDLRPVHDHVEDLINYNALNLFSSWAGRPRAWLNPYGELYPVVPTQKYADARVNLFHFGSVFDAFLPETTPEAAPPDEPVAARFFAQVYRDMGVPRRLDFNVEHTYGVVLPLAAEVAAATHADFPVALPTTAVRRDPAPGTPEQHFVTVEYRKEPAGERAVLKFLASWLRPELYRDDASRALHLAAWRAVAELAHAGRIALAGRFRRFDFRQALAAGASVSVAAGLRPVEELETRSWDVTAPLGTLCRRWLEHGAAEEPAELSVQLTGPADPVRISDTSSVIELRLEVTRASSKVPGPEGLWDLVRPLPSVGREGQATAPVAELEVRETFRSWLASLLGGKGPLEGSAEERKGAELVRKVLAESETGPQGSGAWIVPEDFTVRPSGEAVPSICPLSFLPLERDPFLGDGTFPLLGRYLTALQAALDVRSEGWARQRTALDWEAHFRNLEDARNSLGRIAAALVELLLPLSSLEDPALDLVVRAAVEALRRQEGPWRAVRGWLARRIWSDFALFADTKAFLYTRLAGTAAGGMLPEDFFQLVSEKEIREVEGEPPLIDRDRFSFRQGLASLSMSPWFGFAEVLDDARYDNEFEVEAFRLRSFEGILEQLGADRPAAGGRDEVPISRRVLHLPAGEQRLDQSGRLKVALASRQPVVAPVHVFTGSLEEFQTTAGSDRLRPGDRFLLTSLLEGRLIPPEQGTGPEAVLAARSAAFRRSTRLDDTVVTAVFAIRGDEEAATSWTNAFNNDDILVDLRQGEDTESAGAIEVTGDPPAAVKALFEELGQQTDPTAARLEATLLADALSFASSALRAQAPQPPDPTVRPRVRIRERVPRREVEVTIVDGRRNFSALEALLFRNLGEGPGEEPGTFLLMVSAEVPVWSASSLGIIHTRNQDRSFAREFGQASRRSSDARPHQPIRVERLAALQPQSLARGTYPVTEIVRRLLVETGILVLDHPPGEPAFWERFDLSVTVQHDQRTLLRGTFPDPATGELQEEETLFSASLFPLLNHRFRVGDTQAQKEAKTWFPGDYTDYVLDFQWSSLTNLQFFRLEGLRVKIS